MRQPSLPLVLLFCILVTSALTAWAGPKGKKTAPKASDNSQFKLILPQKTINMPSATSSDLTVTTSIRVERVGDFKDKVTLTATGAPVGATLTLTPDHFDNGEGIAVLSIKVSTAALPDEYTIDIGADGGTTTLADQIKLDIGVGGNLDLVLGVGSLIVRGGVTDYKVNTQNNLLQTTNLGRATPQLLTGAAFRLPFGNFTEGARQRFGGHPWYAFLSLKFSPESSQTFNGYVVAGSYKLAKAFSVLAGFSLTPVQEPSPGFQAAAVQVVTQNPNVPIYQRFNASDLQHNKLDAFDGFPLFVQTATGPTTTRVFDGNPTVVHYHGGFIIGVAIPISLKTQLGGK